MSAATTDVKKKKKKKTQQQDAELQSVIEEEEVRDESFASSVSEDLSAPQKVGSSQCPRAW